MSARSKLETKRTEILDMHQSPLSDVVVHSTSFEAEGGVCLALVALRQ